MPGKQRRASESSSLSNWPLKAAGKPSFCYSNELKEGAHLRTMEPAMVLEVPNKSSNILNTFGLSKSHRSGILRARAPRLPFGSCHLARARAHGARIEAAAASAIYYCSPTLESKEAKEGW